MNKTQSGQRSSYSRFRPGSKRGGRPTRPGGRDFVQRRQFCRFCARGINNIDYKNTAMLNNFLSDRAKIIPRTRTGTCAKHQRRLTRAIKRARLLSLLPNVVE